MTEVSTQKTRQMTLRDRLNSETQMAEIARALPKHMSADRMARVALTAMTRVPKLADCEPASFFRCLLDLSAMGLEPDGKKAHLIPFENKKRGVVECQLIVGFQGYLDLAYRSGMIASVHCDVFCEGEEFVENLGKVLVHRIDRSKPRVKPIGAYCVVTFKDGTEKHEVMGRHEIEDVRKSSRSGNSGPWVTHWNEMAKKTVFRRVSKWLPSSPELQAAIDREDEQEQRPVVVQTPASNYESLKTQLLQQVQTEARTVDAEPVQHDLSTITGFEDAIGDCDTEQEVRDLLRKACELKPEDEDWHTALQMLAHGRIAAISSK